MDKLTRLAKYLAAYARIMSAQPWIAGFTYVDAFAGARRAQIRQRGQGARRHEESDDLPSLFDDSETDADLACVLDGSSAASLSITPPFTRYVFLERDPTRAATLEQLRAERSDRCIEVERGDSNEYLRRRFVNAHDWRRWRAVVFLDPFGMQVPWSTLSALAATGAIEVFINFPVNMAIQRFLRRDAAQFTPKMRAKLDAYFGSPGWFDALYVSNGLFGTQEAKLAGSTERLVAWYRERLRSTFGYVSTPHLVASDRGRALYFLVHAGPNARGAEIASHVLGSRVRRRQR